MHNRKLWQAVLSLVLLFAFLFQGTLALAQSTTGNLSGVVLDDTGKPVSGAAITAASPSQTGRATTDGSGRFTVLSLSPDTYTVTVTKTGITPFSQAGITVTADQTQNLTLRTSREIQKIGRTTARSQSQLVHPGVTSEVYSVNSSTQTAVQGLGGGNNIDNAYSAIVSTPGTYVAQGAAGWGQTIFIHGASYSQVGYQYDGIPINRAFDNYNSNTLTNLGQQELQVFTGGAPPDSSSQTVGGYINQVIKTGTYPGTNTLSLGIGSPTFYNQGRFEAGGANPSRTFSYYAGASDYSQSFRYGSQFNGVGQNSALSDLAPFSYLNNNTYTGLGVVPNCLPGGVDPFSVPGAIQPTGGDPGCNARFAFNVGSLQQTRDQEGVVNLHFGIPHRGESGLRDDIQLLGSVSHMTDRYYTSQNDAGSLLSALGGGPPTWPDGVTFPVGTQPLQPAVGLQPVAYLFPSSPTGRALNSALPAGQEDGVQVDTGIVKLQYQHAFSDKAFARVYGYTNYSDWLQNGPLFADAAYLGYAGAYGNVATGQVASDYELVTHTRGASLDLVDQINSRNLLQFTANYTGATTMRYNNLTWLNSNKTKATDLVSYSNGTYTCYNAAGNADSCFAAANRGSFGNPTPYAVTGNAAAAGAQWLVTKVGPTGTYNTVKPNFTSYALTDQVNVTDKLLVNLGLRLEQYNYKLAPMTGGIYDFWYQAAANTLCYDPTDNQPARNILKPGQAPPASPVVALNCPVLNGVQTLHPNGQNGALNYTDVVNGDINRTAFEPRISGTYTFNSDNVLRASFGKYAQPVQTAYVQYNNLDPSSLTSAGGAGGNFVDFFGLGFTTPKHDLSPTISYNSDLSFEHQFRNTDLSISFSPFYRRTFNQYQDVLLGPNFASSYPGANQNSFGYEIALRKGDPSRDGWSGQLSYTFTKTGVQFIDTGTGANAIDNVNSYIQAFNGLTASGTVVDPRNPNSPHVSGSPCYLNTGTKGTPYSGCTVTGNQITVDPAGLAAGAVINPYYFMTPQQLLNRNATYPGYQSAPSSVPDNNGTISPPSVITGFASYKHHKVTVTPSFQLAQTGYYGDPLSVAGVDPRSCTANSVNVPTAPNPGQANYLNCGSALVSGGFLAIPDPETGKFDGFGQFVQPWVLGVNLQLGYDLSKRVHANLLVANLFNRCFGGSKEPWSTGLTAPGSLVCGYGGGNYVSNFYNGSSPYDVAANGSAVQPFAAHAYYPYAQPFQPLNLYFQVQFKL